MAELDAAGLRASDFSLDSHRRIYDALAAMHAGGVPIDLITLADELARHRQLQSVGGVPYLSSLTDGCVPVRSHVQHHAGMVKRAARLQRIQAIGHRAIAAAAQPGAEPSEVVRALRAELQAVAATSEVVTR